MKPALVISLMLVLLPAFFLSSCDLGSEPQSPAPTIEEYFPMRVGSTWLYSYFDPQGNPQRDHEANPVHDFLGVTQDLGQINGHAFYQMTADSLVTYGDGFVVMNLYLNFSSPPAVANEMAPVVLGAGPWFQHLYSIQIYSNPTVAFDSPIYNQDSTIITFNHAQPFASYQDYIIYANVDLAWGWGGGYDEFGDPIIGYGGELNTTLQHQFRTTAESFQPQVSPFSFCIADGKVYRFYPQATSFDLQNLDSCRILLCEPLTVGHTWIAETNANWGGYGFLHSPIVHGTIQSVGNLSVGNYSYSQAVEVGYSFDGDSLDFAHCWFAPGVGIVKYSTNEFTALLEAYNP